MIYFPRVTTFMFASLLVISCSRNYDRIKFSPDAARYYRHALGANRAEKDLFFKTSPSSPLTAEQRIAFTHLSYFPPNLDLVFAVKIIKSRELRRINIAATGGELRPALEYGQVNFDVEGNPVTLHVYRMIGLDSTELFLPFVDATCGRAAYSGGRYIDLTENDSGIYRLDLNYAYNPYCAYNHGFSCPVVPEENHLEVPILAGEMKFQE